MTLVFSPSLPDGPAQGEVIDATDRYSYQPDAGCTPQDLSNLVSPSEREAQRRECANQAQDHRREVDDLTQQTRAAEAVEDANGIARAAYNLARLQLVIGILGTGALAWSLFLTSKATNAAVRGEDLGFAALRAAQEANRITQAANAVDQRPWLHVEITLFDSAKVFTLPEHARDGELGFSLNVNLKIINSGRTPAQNVEVLVQADTQGGIELAMLKAYTKPEQAGFHVVGVVPPNASLDLDFPAFLPFGNPPEQKEFQFGASLLCMMSYDNRRPGRIAETKTYRTTQAFAIEHTDGRKRSTSISTFAIRNGHGALSARPGFGAMT